MLGIPVSLLCVFVWDLGILGLWIGPTCAVLFNTGCYVFLIKMIDWQQLIESVEERRMVDKIKVDSPKKLTTEEAKEIYRQTSPKSIKQAEAQEILRKTA